MDIRTGSTYYYQREVREEIVDETIQAVKKILLEQYIIDHPELSNQEEQFITQLYQKTITRPKIVQPTSIEQNHLDYVTKVITEILAGEETNYDTSYQIKTITDSFRKIQVLRGKWPGMTTRDYGYLEAFCMDRIHQDKSKVLTPGKLVKIIRPYGSVNYQAIERELIREYYENAFYNMEESSSINPISNMIRENKTIKTYRCTEQHSPYLFTVIRNAAYQIAKAQIDHQDLIRTSETLQTREATSRREQRKALLETLFNQKQQLNKNLITRDENILFILSRKLPYSMIKQPYNLTVLEYYALLDIPPKSLAEWKKTDPEWQKLYKRIVYFERNNASLLKEINYPRKEEGKTYIKEVEITSEVNQEIYQKIDQYGYPRVEGVYFAFRTAYVNGKLEEMEKRSVRSRLIRNLSQTPKFHVNVKK